MTGRAPRTRTRRRGVALWQNMAQAGGPRAPEFLSTHPSYGARAQAPAQRMPHALARAEQARRSGRAPAC